MPRLKDIDAYVDIDLEYLLGNVSLEEIHFTQNEMKIFTEVFLKPLTKETTIRFNDPKTEKYDFGSIEGNNFCKLSDKIIKKFFIPSYNFIVFNHFCGKKEGMKTIKTLNFDNNIICYRQEEGCVRSLLHVIRNSLAHGNVFMCRGGFVMFSINKENKVNGIIKFDKLSDFLKLIEMLKKESSLKTRKCV